VQEEPPAGLYLYRSGAAVQLVPPGASVRTDYAWSADGSQFAYSSPDLSDSASGGVWLASVANPTSPRRLWASGSHPRFYQLASEGIICAGPPDDTARAGIWQKSLDGTDSARLTSTGVYPEISPDGRRIAFLRQDGDLLGTLMVLDRSTGQVTTLVGNTVADFDWLGSSQEIVFEFSAADGSPQISTYALPSGPISVSIFGTSPKRLPASDHFVFTGLSGTHTNGLFIGVAGQELSRVSASGSFPFPSASNRIVAQDTSGIVELTQ
jgi:Tol biopolymer transport system component